jgi:hypothetical protein
MMNRIHPPFYRCTLALVCGFLLMAPEQPAHAYITAPVTTLGQLGNWSTYVTVVEVEKVSKEKGIIIYRKVKDLKGKYPKDRVKHVFDLKNTPAHKGPGDVPVRPNEEDWRHAVAWAEPGKTAVMATLKYDPYGDFGHTYIDGCWYATMCPPRDWEHWYSIYSDAACMNRWHGGALSQLVPALEAVLAGKEAIVPVLVKGTREELRQGRGQLEGMKISIHIGDFNPKRDLVPGWLEKEIVGPLVKALANPAREARLQAVQELGKVGAAPSAIAALAQVVRNDASGTVRLRAAELLGRLGPEAKSARPALEAALNDPRIAQRQEVLDKIREALAKVK